MFDEHDLESSQSPSIRANVNEAIAGNAMERGENYMSGNQEARGLLNAPDKTNSTLSYSNPESAAIRSRYIKSYGQNEHALNTELMKNASSDNIRKLQLATDAASKEVEMNRQKELLRWKINQANKKARGQVLGSVLGIGAGIAGAAAGGPGGAIAGYSAGQGIGNMYGSAN